MGAEIIENTVVSFTEGLNVTAPATSKNAPTVIRTVEITHATTSSTSPKHPERACLLFFFMESAHSLAKLENLRTYQTSSDDYSRNREPWSGGTRVRTGDTMIFSHVLYQLSYPAVTVKAEAYPAMILE